MLCTRLTEHMQFWHHLAPTIGDEVHSVVEEIMQITGLPATFNGELAAAYRCRW